MATFNFSRMNVDIDSDDIVAKFITYGPLKNLNVKVHTATEFQLQLGVSTVKYEGTGFKYQQNFDPKAGTIKNISTFIVNHANDTFNITGLSLKIADMKTAFATKGNPFDDIALVNKIFAGDDTFQGGRANDKFYGLDGADKMTGVKGNDNLNGGAGNDSLSGGLGLDTLTGGDGKDTFIFDTSPKNDHNMDTITDFNAADDTIKLDDKFFYGIGGPGALADAKFFHGTPVAHQNGAITYDDANGDLYWTYNSGLTKLFAHLEGTPTLTAANFEII